MSRQSDLDPPLERAGAGDAGAGPAAPEGHGSHHRLQVIAAILAVIAALLGVATAFLTYLNARAIEQRDRAEAEVSSLTEQVGTLSDGLAAAEAERDALLGDLQDLNLRFNPVEGTIPHCNDFSGTGVIPEGWTLVIFDRSLVNPNEPYWFNKPAEPTESGWVARRVQIGDGEGDTGRRVEISAVLLPDDFATYLSSIGSEEVWWATRLPAEPATTMIVERNRDSEPCR